MNWSAFHFNELFNSTLEMNQVCSLLEAKFRTQLEVVVMMTIDKLRVIKMTRVPRGGEGVRGVVEGLRLM